MSTIKKILRFIIELLLTIIFALYIVLQIASSTILNENYILSMLNKTDYYSKVYEIANSGFENYIYQSGLDESVIQNIVSEEKIEEDTLKIISNIYEGENQEISTQEIRDELEKNIKESTGKTTFSDSQQEAIDTFINKICEEYKVSILSSSYENKIYSIIEKVTRYANIIRIILAVSIIILIGILLLLDIHHKYRWASDIGIGLFASCILLVGINLYLDFNIQIKNITLLNEAFSETLVNILQEVFETIVKYGIAFGIIGLILIIVPTLFHNKNKYKNG